MNWKIILFDNNSNPYICKTDKEFNRIRKKYNLHKTGVKDYYWASDKVPEEEFNKNMEEENVN